MAVYNTKLGKHTDDNGNVWYDPGKEPKKKSSSTSSSSNNSSTNLDAQINEAAKILSTSQIENDIKATEAKKVARTGSLLTESEKQMIREREIAEKKTEIRRSLAQGQTVTYQTPNTNSSLTNPTALPSQAQKQKTYSYDYFADSSGKKYYPQSGIKPNAFAQETSINGKQAYVSGNNVVFTGRNTAPIKTPAEEMTSTIQSINMSLQKPKANYDTVTKAPDKNIMAQIVGRADTAIASTISRGQSNSFKEMAIGSKLSTAQKQADVLAFLNPLRNKISSTKKSLEPDQTRVDILPKPKREFTKGFAIGALGVAEKVTNEPITEGIKIYTFGKVLKVPYVAPVLTSAMVGSMAAQIDIQPTYEQKINQLGEFSGEFAGYSLIASSPKLLSKGANAVINSEKMFTDKSGAVFRDGRRISPKSKAQMRKDSLRQSYDPKISFNEGKLIQRTKNGKNELSFLRDGNNIIRQKSTIIEKNIGDIGKLRFTRVDSTQYEPVFNRNKFKGFVEKKLPQKITYDNILKGNNRELGGKAFSRPASQVKTSLSGISSEQMQILEQKAGSIQIPKRQPVKQQQRYINNNFQFSNKDIQLIEGLKDPVELNSQDIIKIKGGFRKGQKDRLYSSLREKAAIRKQNEAVQELNQLNQAAELWLRTPIKIEVIESKVNSKPIVDNFNLINANKIDASAVQTFSVVESPIKTLVFDKSIIGAQQKVKTQNVLKAKSNTQILSLGQSAIKTNTSLGLSLKSLVTPIISNKSLVKNDLLVRQKTNTLFGRPQMTPLPMLDTKIKNTNPSGMKPVISNIVKYKPPKQSPIARKVSTKKKTPEIFFGMPSFKYKGSNKKNPNIGVFVKRRGVFKQIGGSLNSIDQAFSIGAKKTQETSAASFMVKVNGNPVRNSPFALPNFRKSKKSDFVFVENNKSRINTLGELKEITFKMPF